MSGEVTKNSTGADKSHDDRTKKAEDKGWMLSNLEGPGSFDNVPKNADRTN